MKMNPSLFDSSAVLFVSVSSFWSSSNSLHACCTFVPLNSVHSSLVLSGSNDCMSCILDSLHSSAFS